MDSKKTYNCDYMLNNSVWGEYPENIMASQNFYGQIIHTDYEVLLRKQLFTYEKHKKVTHHIACGEFVGKQFTKVTGYECTPIKNILGKTLPINKIYKFIYAGRIIDEDKNISLERIKIFANMMEKANIKYKIDIYTNGETDELNDYENIKIYKPKFYDIHDELADADYCILFSNAEGLPCQVQEALQYGTPCIVTECEGSKELIKDGKNGFVVPFDMNFDINKIKKIPIVKNYDNGTSAKTWCDFIGGSEYKKKPLNKKKIIKPKDTKEIEVKKTFNGKFKAKQRILKDNKIDYIEIGEEVIDVNYTRMAQLFQFNLIERMEE